MKKIIVAAVCLMMSQACLAGWIDFHFINTNWFKPSNSYNTCVLDKAMHIWGEREWNEREAVAPITYITDVGVDADEVDYYNA